MCDRNICYLINYVVIEICETFTEICEIQKVILATQIILSREICANTELLNMEI